MVFYSKVHLGRMGSLASRSALSRLAIHSLILSLLIFTALRGIMLITLLNTLLVSSVPWLSTDLQMPTMMRISARFF